MKKSSDTQSLSHEKSSDTQSYTAYVLTLRPFEANVLKRDQLTFTRTQK